MAYLFAHFKEKLTPDGEQVYFAVSRDGLHYEKVNDGNPVLTAVKGEKGSRDIEILRLRDNGFVILTTDLCVARRYDKNLKLDWPGIAHNGSKYLRMWRTDNLVDFSDEKLIYFGRDDFGCLWAPETFYDEINEEYIIHWSSNCPTENEGRTSIFCTRTKDFETFSYPRMLFGKENEVIDSHLEKVGDEYFLFYKNCDHPGANFLVKSKSLEGGWEDVKEFNDYILTLEKPGSYEAPTVYTLPDGRWCLMLDFFGCEKEKMGYVPFISSKPGDIHFRRAEESFSFPYGFKHGGVIEITDEEYERLKRI